MSEPYVCSRPLVASSSTYSGVTVQCDGLMLLHGERALLVCSGCGREAEPERERRSA